MQSTLSTEYAKRILSRAEMRDRNAPLEPIVAAFLRTKRLEQRSPATIAWYDLSLRHFIAWLRAQGRAGAVGDIDPELLRLYMEYRQRQGVRVLRTGTQASGSDHQARAIAVATKSLATYLACEGILADAATTFCRRCRRIHAASVLMTLTVPQVQDETRDELTESEVAAGIERSRKSFNARRDELILRLALSGLRKLEIVGLRLRDIDFDNGTIFVRPEFAKYHRKRTMTLWPEVATAVDRYLVARQGDDNSDAPLLLRQDGSPLTYSGVSSVFRRLRFSAHRGRHTGVSGYFRAGSGSTIDAMREFGWKDERMALRYDHVRPAEERLARPSPFGGFRGSRKQVVNLAKRRSLGEHSATA